MSKYTTLESVKVYVALARLRLVELGFRELNSKKILIEWNTRAKNRLGQCSPKRLSDGQQYYVLSFNKKYFEIGDDVNVQGTIVHEVAHCVANGLSHEHSSGWYKAIIKYNATYGTNIQRCSFDANYNNYLKQQLMDNGKYKIYCDYCKKVVKIYQRECSVVQGIRHDPSNWRCGCCNKNTLRIL